MSSNVRICTQTPCIHVPMVNLFAKHSSRRSKPKQSADPTSADGSSSPVPPVRAHPHPTMGELASTESGQSGKNSGAAARGTGVTRAVIGGMTALVKEALARPGAGAATTANEEGEGGNLQIARDNLLTVSFHDTCTAVVITWTRSEISFEPYRSLKTLRACAEGQ